MSQSKSIFKKIKKHGWRNLPPAVLYRFKLLSGNIYRHLILRNKLVAHLFPFQQPPILLLSYPRSGSSWVGDILASSQDIAYFFEPVTSPYQKYHQAPALADLSDPAVYRAYSEYSRNAFLGIPQKQRFPRDDWRGFSPLTRRNRRLLIKEVNPRAAAFYYRHYQPSIFFLVRHPAAVALSFWRTGWLSGADVQMEAVLFDGDDWEKFGYAYGTLIRNALAALDELSAPYKIVFYEQLALNPLQEFKKIFQYMQVELPENYEDVIREYCYTDTAVQGYHTRRLSAKMVSKWKHKLAPAEISKIRHAYLLSGLDFYRSDADWDTNLSDKAN